MQIGMRAAGACADVGLGGTASGEDKGGPQQVYLRLTYLLLGSKTELTSFSVCYAVVEVLHGEVIVNLELDIIEQFVANRVQICSDGLL